MLEAIFTFVVAIILVYLAFTFIGNVLQAALFILAVAIVYFIIRAVVERRRRV